MNCLNQKFPYDLLFSGLFTKNDDAMFSVRSFLQRFRKEHDVVIKEYEFDDNIIKAGNNFCSAISRLRFKYVDKDGKSHSKAIILKIPTLGLNYEMIRHTNVYSKEIYVLEQFLPDLRKLYPEESDFTAKYYGTNDSQVLFLEDLGQSGYTCMEKTAQLDLEHSRVAVKTLARYHALTYKYLQTYGANNSNLDVITDPDVANTFLGTYDRLVDAISPLVSKSMAEKLRERKSRVMDEALEYYKFRPCRNGKTVIIHGDYWSSNILFKHDEEGRICNSKMVDWQITRIGCPAMELIHFFVSSVRFEIFEKCKDDLLNIYLDEFNAMLKKLRCDDEYTRQELDNDLKSYEHLYFNLGVFMLPIVIGNDTGKLNDSDFDNSINSSAAILVKWLTYMESHGIL